MLIIPQVGIYIYIDNLPNMILSVAALRIKITIVSVDMPHLLSKWLETKATNLVSRILKMRIPHLQSFVFLYFLKYRQYF